MTLRYIFLFLTFLQVPFLRASMIIDLVDSVDIIQTLIEKKQLAEILEDHNPNQLKLLLRNYSPAQLALISEVDNCPIPVLLYFYDPKKFPDQPLKQLKDFVQQSPKEIKLVVVDLEKLFSLVMHANIEDLPAVIFMNKGKEFARLEGDEVAVKAMQEKLQEIFQ